MSLNLNLNLNLDSDLKERIQKIRAILFDIDGTMTDGKIYVGKDGELFKAFDCKDGMAVTLWHKAGGLSGIITGRSSEITQQRANRLKIAACYQGRLNKLEAYRDFKKNFSLRDDEIAFIGDDLIDLPIMLRVGLAVAVGDACEEVKDYAHIVTQRNGGYGAVRELIELILKTQNKWQGIVDDFLNRQ